ncbi:unnamed protein product [Meganyctiphanes norvegica]|uniref:C-type lectin domain-containing protein n=1 Tax=Meganyctiphanes norvegica TaxID=48144 RepID=A0AAV2SRR4_MEGNR
MDVIILSLLLALGVQANQMPLKDPLDNSENAIESAPVVSVDLFPVKSYKLDNEFANTVSSSSLADQHPVESEVPPTTADKEKAGTTCKYPFEAVDNHCYLFSDVQMNFLEAIKYCENLSYGHTQEITLALLDHNNDKNQALLGAAAQKNITFWLGGKTEDNNKWKWLTNRDVDLMSPFWYENEPNEATNKCMVAKVNTHNTISRSYIHDNDCNDSLNFICQTGCPLGFLLMSNQCFFVSENIGLPHLSWQEARDYCESLSVPVGYHSDLAVFDHLDHDSFHLMNSLATSYTFSNTWIGLLSENDCEYKWIDGTSLPTTSNYWQSSDPICGNHNRGRLYYSTSNRRTYLGDATDSYNYPFICQIFKND